MIQIISEKQKGIFRALSILSAVPALWLAYHLVLMFWRELFSLDSGSLFVFVIGAFLAVVCFFLLRLTLRLWTQYDLKQMNRWALLPAIFISLQIHLAISDGCESLLSRRWSELDMSFVGIEIAQFFALAAAGITYRIVKCRLYQTIDRTELINPIEFKGHRKMYFTWLSILFGFMLFSLRELYAPIGTDRGDMLGLPFLLLSPLLAILFYKLCVYLFVTRPLKHLQPEPSTFRLRSRP